ncbi:MAG TPA: hypothetical protein VLK24_00515 [Gaiellaceae bacterium]|nr:hypothetical protein [Gaiellaceae bacterium]
MRFWLRLRRRFASERGMALVMAIGITSVLGIVGTTAMAYSTTNSVESTQSVTRQNAFTLAEAGINNAVAVLNNTSNNSLDPTLLPSRTSCSTALTSTCSSPYGNGYVTWSGTLDRSAAVWTLTSTGYSRNTSKGNAGYSSKTLTAKVSITPTITQPLNNPSWNYIMSTQTGNTCDMTLSDGNNTGNPLTVAAQLYVLGNLCIGTNQGGVAYAMAPVIVQGKVTIENGSIGKSGQPVSDVHVKLGCKYQSNTLHNPCRNGAPSAGDNVFATVIDSNPTTLTPPSPAWDTWYANAIPGPKQSCTSSSGTPPTFDGDASRNNSVAAVFDLTPASSYTCRVGPGAIASLSAAMNTTQTTVSVTSAAGFPTSGTYRIRVDDELMTVTAGQGTTTWTVTRHVNGSTAAAHSSGQTAEWDDANTIGEINWNATSKTLTTKGTIFIDGSAKVSQNSTYNGQSTLYLSGTFLMDGTRLCALSSGSSCDTANWNPNADLLTIVANGSGGQVPAGHSIYLNDAQFQGALFATAMVRLEGTTVSDGPVIGTNVELGYDVSTSTATAAFPTLSIVPVGMPSNPVVYAQPNPPQMFSG